MLLCPESNQSRPKLSLDLSFLCVSLFAAILDSVICYLLEIVFAACLLSLQDLVLCPSSPSDRDTHEGEKAFIFCGYFVCGVENWFADHGSVDSYGLGAFGWYLLGLVGFLFLLLLNVMEKFL